MSLNIDIDTIAAVLLPDGWHDVALSTFVVDDYELVAIPYSDRGQFVTQHGDLGAGFSFSVPDPSGSATDEFLSGPLASILAVRFEVAHRPTAEQQERAQ